MGREGKRKLCCTLLDEKVQVKFLMRHGHGPMAMWGGSGVYTLHKHMTKVQKLVVEGKETPFSSSFKVSG